MARGSIAGGLCRFLACGLAVSLGAPLVASQGKSSPAGSIVSAFVWDAASKPVAGVVVSLRNVRTGRVDRAVSSDDEGHVSFRAIESGSYLLEVVNSQGGVIATGQVFTIAPGESVATFVRLAARSPWYSGLFDNAGAIAIASAAGLGATARATTGQPQSPGR